jgi:hypothetical protein
MVQYVKEWISEKPLVGVEIGVAYGMNAESILRTLNMKTLYLVDSYKPYIQGDMLVPSFATQTDAMKRLEPYKSKIHLICEDSVTASKQIPDGLDFVYFDGNHDCDHVLADIEAYYPKVRQGGILGGHDFRNSYLGVVKAVSELVAGKVLQLIRDRNDWWIIKACAT